MIQFKLHHQNEPEPEGHFWASYSDLLAGMLMIFVLLLVVAMVNYSQNIRRQSEILDNQKERLQSFHEIQQNLISDLEREMKDVKVTVDPNTGVLQIGSGILFGEDEAELREDSKALLQQIFDAYIHVVLSEEYQPYIRRIEIEGHTNSHGTYLYNLELSQRRALVVMGELLDRVDADRRKEFEGLVIAGGRSFSNLILDEEGREDKIRSRRIEIKFRLKESEMFREIYRDLEL